MKSYAQWLFGARNWITVIIERSDHSLPSVLWCCWLGGRKGIRPVKHWVVGAGVVVCLERDADLHMAQLMPLPLTVSCFTKIQIGSTFLVPAHLSSPGKRAVKRVFFDHSLVTYWGLNFCWWLFTTFWCHFKKSKKSCFFEIWKKRKIRILEHCPQTRQPLLGDGKGTGRGRA